MGRQLLLPLREKRSPQSQSLLVASTAAPRHVRLISIPDDQRDDFISALKQLALPDGELVENVPDNPGTVGINFESGSDPQWAAERLGQIVDAANQVAGRAFHAVGGGAYWPETGETL